MHLHGNHLCGEWRSPRSMQVLAQTSSTPLLTATLSLDIHLLRRSIALLLRRHCRAKCPFASGRRENMLRLGEILLTGERDWNLRLAHSSQMMLRLNHWRI
jgi:hypothetical protein